MIRISSFATEMYSVIGTARFDATQIFDHGGEVAAYATSDGPASYLPQALVEDVNGDLVEVYPVTAIEFSLFNTTGGHVDMILDVDFDLPLQDKYGFMEGDNITAYLFNEDTGNIQFIYSMIEIIPKLYTMTRQFLGFLIVHRVCSFYEDNNRHVIKVLMCYQNVPLKRSCQGL